MQNQNKVKVSIQRISDVPLPEYAKMHDAGMDVVYSGSKVVEIAPHFYQLLPTGLRVAIPVGYEIQVRPRSGLALKKGISVLNTPGTIDPGYRGEIGVILINHDNTQVYIKPGDRIAQIVLKKVEYIDWEEVDELPSTDRGQGGFGSTGE